MEGAATRMGPSQGPSSVRRQISFNAQSCIRNWRIWFKAVSAIAYVAILTVFLPWWIAKMVKHYYNYYCHYEYYYESNIIIILDIIRLQVREGASPRMQAFLAAGIFLMMTLPISLYEIAGHIGNYSKPYLQKHIIRVLWMVPIYSINSVSIAEILSLILLI